MRTFEEIINNKALTIKTQIKNENEEIQIRAYYNDPLTRKSYWCKFTKAMGWEHVTVAGVNNKVPSYDAMCKVKDIFWNDEECCIQFHPRKSQYINNHEYCLHIWRPIDIELPEPPTILVGIHGMNSDEMSTATKSFVEHLSPEETQQLAKKLGINVGNRAMRRH